MPGKRGPADRPRYDASAAGSCLPRAARTDVDFRLGFQSMRVVACLRQSSARASNGLGRTYVRRGEPWGVNRSARPGCRRSLRPMCGRPSVRALQRRTLVEADLRVTPSSTLTDDAVTSPSPDACDVLTPGTARTCTSVPIRRGAYSAIALVPLPCAHPARPLPQLGDSCRRPEMSTPCLQSDVPPRVTCRHRARDGNKEGPPSSPKPRRMDQGAGLRGLRRPRLLRTFFTL